MFQSASKRFLMGTLAALSVLAWFGIWALVDNESLRAYAREDRAVEYGTSILFAIASLGFFRVALKSEYLRGKSGGLRYFTIVSWALLMFAFAGEEISWGQRLFDFSTPDSMKAGNVQHEFNLHNHETFMNESMGGAYRLLSIMMLMIGALIPLAGRTPPGRKLAEWLAYPMMPEPYWLFFIGALVFGTVFPRYTFHHNDAAEIREFIMSIGMVLYAWHGLFRPADVFPGIAVRTAEPKAKPDPSVQRSAAAT